MSQQDFTLPTYGTVDTIVRQPTNQRRIITVQPVVMSEQQHLGGPVGGAVGQAAGGFLGEYVGDQAQQRLFQQPEARNQEGVDQVDAGGDEAGGGGGSHVGTSVNESSVLINNVPVGVEHTVKVYDISGCINIKNMDTANAYVQFPWNYLWNWIPEEEIKPMAGSYRYFQPTKIELSFMRGSTHQVTQTNQVFSGVNHGAMVYFYCDYSHKYSYNGYAPYTHALFQKFADSWGQDGFTGTTDSTQSTPFFFPWAFEDTKGPNIS